MADENSSGAAGSSASRSATQLGFWAASLLAVSATVALAVAVTTPPRSGPFCTGSCIAYPYTAAAAFVPGDYLWMYPASLMALLFIVLVACLHHRTAVDKQVFSQVGLALAVISGAALLVDYAIQLAVMQPSLGKGEIANLSLFSQYNPHGVFIALEDLGYLLMGAAFFFLAVALGPSHGLQRAVRILYLITSFLAVGSLALLVLLFGTNLEYRYEVAIISIDWIALILSGVLLSVIFRRDGRTPQEAS